MKSGTTTLAYSPGHRPRPRLAGWYSAAWGVALMVALPVLAVFYLALFPDENIWTHLASTVLPVYIITTVQLIAGVALLSMLAGVGSAWLVTMYSFPGKRLFEWALLLPFAVPAYVIAYVYTDLLEFAGPVQGALRALFGWQSARDYWFPEIRSLGGAILMLSLVLYPYIYLLTRAAFLEQSVSLRDASRLLGCNAWQSFYRVSLPIARPAIAVGVSLVAMETINDFGTVDFFAVKSLTAGIYDTWLNMYNLGGAAQIASLMLIFVVMLVTLERVARAQQRQFHSPDRFSALQPTRLRGFAALGASLFCLLPVLCGFIVPFSLLGWYASGYLDQLWSEDFLSYASHSFTLSFGAAVLSIALAVVLAYAKRLYSEKRALLFAVRFSSLGYAMPGAVLALGVIIPLAAFDNAVDDFMRRTFDISTGLLLSGTTFAIIFAYVVRFLAVSNGAVDSSLSKVTPSMDMASRSLGHTASQTLVKVHLPLIRGGLMTALLVVFVDCMKELPATLILRPFNYDTLATFVYQFASDEMLERSALAALLIVLVGVLPVILLSRSITATRRMG
ncbi:ABC transporter permease [Marinobacterium rhizophilum]|uniref:Iron ABC transporter permease n=1 Tax=Marinobacterium rhizophilum TaxID=420402 RepID=A0ABY5HS95_9GAMM|nr:iron ABC transporter permease [Marinobacterium rhizophilum]UTW14074.1 iron ABC transporter permease [Marinobacterium rhizophilum]